MSHEERMQAMQDDLVRLQAENEALRVESMQSTRLYLNHESQEDMAGELLRAALLTARENPGTKVRMVDLPSGGAEEILAFVTNETDWVAQVLEGVFRQDESPSTWSLAVEGNALWVTAG